MIFDAVENFYQPKNGYRFSADSIILADFAEPQNARRLADLGAGSGIVGLAALEKQKVQEAKDFYFIEITPAFMKPLQANLNLYRPRTQTSLHPLNRDWRNVSINDLGGPLDYILSNPPYFPLVTSRPSPNPTKNAARRETHGTLSDLCAAITRLLAPQGRAALMLPLVREEELLAALKGNAMKPLRTEQVEGRLVLVEAAKAV